LLRVLQVLHEVRENHYISLHLTTLGSALG
jgi:hypothetical protein